MTCLVNLAEVTHPDTKQVKICFFFYADGFIYFLQQMDYKLASS